MSLYTEGAEIKMNRSPKSNSFFSSNRVLLLGIALIIVSAGLLIGPLFAPQVAPQPSTDAQALLTGAASDLTAYTDKAIADSQARVKSVPDDYMAWAQLGAGYLQKARETSDPTYYAKAEEALQKSLGIKPDYYNALAGLGSLDLSRHNFQQALDWGLKAQALSPAQSYAYGVIGDAQIELGLYDQAVGTFQKMVDTRPDLSSYSRVSYARELYGQVDGAIQAMQQAINAGSPAAENTAWCRVQLGNLYFNTNQLDKAEQQYNDALLGYPDYIYGLAGLAQVRWAQGKNDEAIKLLKGVVDRVPLPQYVTSLADMYAANGDSDNAKMESDLVLYTYKVFEANGVNVDIEKAAFLADHDMDIPQALTLIQRAAAVRQDVNTADTLAWVLYKSGKYQDALAASQKALRLGTQNALFYFHQGMVYKALGDNDKARESLQKALQINPYFSIKHSQEAVDALKGLGTGG